jgi:hypothetical protein
MSEITPIKAYATTDGQIFSTQQEAQAHQHGLDIKKEVWKFFDYDGSKSNYFDTYISNKVAAVIEWEVAKMMKGESK